jgi:hypothetical protein
MAYQNKFVAAIRANGKILREHKDTVFLPFGCEYEFRLKNLNTVRANINIYIDGDNIVPGGLVLNAGQEIDLQRAIRNGNMNEGNRFKFIERTGKIEDHRGIKLEDGLIRVEYQFEKVFKRQDGINWISNHHYYHYGYDNCWNPNNILRSSGGGTATPSWMTGTTTCGGDGLGTTYAAVNNMAVGATLTASSAQAFNAAPQTETGITVPGSKSEQKFVTVSDFICEPEKHNIILKLLGETPDNEVVRKPITVKHKQKCNTCGKQNKAASKFCSECGTALEIFA